MNISVLPLFSSPVFVLDILENIDDYYSQIKNLDFSDINVSKDNKCFVSKKYNLLDSENFSGLKKNIQSYFDMIKNDVLFYNDTEFKITTSWATKVVNNSVSHFHNHQNSMYSGVLYFEDYEKKSFIEFNSFDRNVISPNPPSEKNFFNCSSWMFETRKNRLIIFPSYLFHRVVYKDLSKDRYSLAFNIIPVGKFGSDDSSLNLTLNNL